MLHYSLFVLGFTSHSRIFHSYGNVNITDELLHILTFSRPLRDDRGHPFIMVISEYWWHSLPVTERLIVEMSLPVTNDLGLPLLGLRQQTIKA